MASQDQQADGRRLSGALSFQLRDPPKAHVPSDVDASTLAQALSQLEANQSDIQTAEAALQALLRKRSNLQLAERFLSQQKLLDVVAQGPLTLGFQDGIPIAALAMYRSLLEWGALVPAVLPDGRQASPQPILEQLSELLVHLTDEDVIAAHHRGDDAAQGTTAELAYWLSTIVTLMVLVAPHIPGKAAQQAPGDGRTESVAVRAAAVAHKVKQELTERMTATFGALGKNLLRRNKPTAPAAAAAAPEQGHGGDAEAEAAQAVRSPSMDAPEDAHDAASLQTTSTATTATAAGLNSSNGGGNGTTLAAQQQAFRHTLDVIVQKCYSQVRDALKRQVSQLLPECIQMPPSAMSPRATSPVASAARPASPPPVAPAAPLPRPQQPLSDANCFSLESDDEDVPGHVAAAVVLAQEQQAESAAAHTAAPVAIPDGHPEAPADAPSTGHAPSIAAWVELVEVLSLHMRTWAAAHMPRIVVKCLLKQVLRFVDSQLFNQLLLRPECCCTSNARYVVAGLQHLDAWINAGGVDNTADLRVLAEDLRHVRQASHFLVLANKGALRLDDIVGVCPSLNMQQLYRLCTTFYDDTPIPLQRVSGGGATPSAGPVPQAGSDSLAAAPADGGAAAIQHPLQPGSSTDAGAPAAPAKALDGGSSGSGSMGGGTALDRNVSGEVLEEMKRHHAVANNGGLIVTFLLDEDGQLIIAPGGTVSPDLLRIIYDQHLRHHKGWLTIPDALISEDCPRQAFAFLEKEPVPSSVAEQ